MGSEIPYIRPQKKSLPGMGFPVRGNGLCSYLIGMDHRNIRNMEKITGRHGGKIKLLLSYCGRNDPVQDPWYTGDFKTAYEDVRDGCEGLFQYLQSNKKSNA